MTNALPWLIRFDPAGISTAQNQTGRTVWALHDANLQPSRLEIRGAGGVQATSFDTRSTKKFDNTVRKASFRQVEAGAVLPLFRLQIAPRDGLFELRWGPFRIGPLAPGEYTGTVSWEARESEYFDEAAGQRRRLEGAWVGSVSSEPVPFKLPPP